MLVYQRVFTIWLLPLWPVITTPRLPKCPENLRFFRSAGGFLSQNPRFKKKKQGCKNVPFNHNLSIWNISKNDPRATLKIPDSGCWSSDRDANGHTKIYCPYNQLLNQNLSMKIHQDPPETVTFFHFCPVCERLYSGYPIPWPSDSHLSQFFKPFVSAGDQKFSSRFASLKHIENPRELGESWDFISHQGIHWFFSHVLFNTSRKRGIQTANGHG